MGSFLFLQNFKSYNQNSHTQPYKTAASGREETVERAPLCALMVFKCVENFLLVT